MDDKQMKSIITELYPYLNNIEEMPSGLRCLAEPIIVYQVGRVGSKSIVGSLQKYGYKNVFHVHQLPDKVNGPEEYIEQMGRKNKTILDSYVVRKFGLLGRSRIITLVRDPVERSLSGFFYQFRNEDVEKLRMLSGHPEDLLEIFIKSGPGNYTLQWFDREFRKRTKLDIYKYGFNKEYGCSVVGDKGLRVLIIKAESNNNIKEKAIEGFLGCGEFILETKNTAAEWNHYEIYNKFKKEVKFPLEYLDKMYKSKLTAHFYSDDEIRTFYEKWG